MTNNRNENTQSKLLKVSVGCKVRAGKLLWIFLKVSESRYSPQVLVGAPAQGYSSPLVLARTKCSLWDDHLPLRYSGSLRTANKLESGHQQILKGNHRALNATESSWWCRSPRVISHKLSLDQEKSNACGMCSRWLLLVLMRSYCEIMISLITSLCNVDMQAQCNEYYNVGATRAQLDTTT
jgi:hypothetical protein